MMKNVLLQICLLGCVISGPVAANGNPGISDRKQSLREEPGAEVSPAQQNISYAMITPAGRNADSTPFTLPGNTLFNPAPPVHCDLPWNYFAGGEVYIIASSHNDIAWFDTPEKTAEFREKDCLLPALERMRNRKDVYFSMENVLYLHEFLERQPLKRDEVFRVTASNHLDWGATYNQPYESLLSGEQLVRQVYYGAKQIRKMIPGTTARVAYNLDVPGRSLQMPQILAKANVPYLLLSRHERSLFNWASPDGSSVLCWSMDHYYDLHQLKYASSTQQFAELVQQKAAAWQPAYEASNLPPVNGVLFSEDYTGPVNFDRFMDTLAVMRNNQLANGMNENPPSLLPKFRYASAEEFFDRIAPMGASLKTITGERPNVWLYIHGPTHHQAITSKREAGRLLPVAEVFSTVNALLQGSMDAYPHRAFEDAWTASIYDDHGWGGNNGQITDLDFKRKLDFARDQGKKLLGQALQGITRQISTNDQPGQPIVVYNTLSWNRTDPVTHTISSDSDDFSITGPDGKTVPHQILRSINKREYEISFIGEDIPSLGYKTYYVVSSGRKKGTSVLVTANDAVYENRYYRLSFGRGGLNAVFDRQLNREMVISDKFKAGDILSLHSVGNGAGEFADIQQPSMEGYEQAGLGNVVWILKSNGQVFAEYEAEYPLRNATVKQKVRIYHSIKRIDFEVSLLNWDGKEYREFRFALPLDMKDSKVTYEVPMGKVTIGEDEIEGAAGWRHTTECKEVHPREVQNFISVNNDKAGVTLSTSVAVFDHIDPTGSGTDYPVIQPVLLASRRSCHDRGNWYLQDGDHHYSFSLFSHEAGWENGYRSAIQANNPLIPVPGENQKGLLPSVQSFFSLSSDNAIISTVKKAEDDNSVVTRIYDMEGHSREVKINTFFEIGKSELTNIIEEEGKFIPHEGRILKARLGHHAIETFKLWPVLR